MATQKPLVDMIHELHVHIQKNMEFLQFNQRVFNVFEGQLKREIEYSLSQEILSPSALKRCLQRIPSINVMKKATDKLSKVYIEAPIRLADSPKDIELMDNIVKISELDTTMMHSNQLMNAMNSCAIEPYLDGREQKIRTIPNHLFLPYSDDPSNPLKMTVFIKLLGSEQVKDYTTTAKDGTNIEETKRNIRVVNIYQAFSDEEVIIFDSSGSLRMDWMEDFGIESGINEFGVIPQTYVNSSVFQLIPFANQLGFDISVLIPKLLADLNYSVQFLSHSIIWAKNTDLEATELNPDALVNLGDSISDGPRGEPEIGTIDPKVDIEAQLQLIEFELSAYFSSVGIKTATQGSMMPGREASGFAKAMDEGDTTAVRKEQTETFRHVETRMWKKINQIQRVWSANGLVDESRQFSSSFDESFSIKFAEMKILKTDKEKLEEVQVLRDLKLMTKKQALRKIMPDLTDAQINDWVKELDTEAEEAFDAMMPQMQMINNEEKTDTEMSKDPAESQRDEELGE